MQNRCDFVFDASGSNCRKQYHHKECYIKKNLKCISILSSIGLDARCGSVVGQWHTSCCTSRFACPLPVCGSARLDIVCVDVIQTWHCFVSFALCSAALGAHVWTSVPILLTSFTHYYFLHIRYAYFALFLLAICIRDSISHSNVCVYNIGTTRCCWRSSSLTHPSSVHLFSQEQWCCMSLFQEEWPIILLMSKPITQPAKSQMTVSTLLTGLVYWPSGDVTAL